MLLFSWDYNEIDKTSQWGGLKSVCATYTPRYTPITFKSSLYNSMYQSLKFVISILYIHTVLSGNYKSHSIHSNSKFEIKLLFKLWW